MVTVDKHESYLHVVVPAAGLAPEGQVGRHESWVGGERWIALADRLIPGSDYLPFKSNGNESLHRQWGKAVFVDAVAGIAHDYRQRTGLLLGIGDLSHVDGGKIEDHWTHQKGVDVDLYLIDPAVTEKDPAAVEALIALTPDLLGRARDALAGAAASREVERRIRRQLIDESTWERLPTVLTALKCREALEKAQGFGRAANGIHDDAQMAVALQSLPHKDRTVSALLMMAAVGSVANPIRLMTAAAKIAGAATETAIMGAGFAPLVEALLAHAQNQVPVLYDAGVFTDVDLTCRAIDRFHRLSRAVAFIEIAPHGRWGTMLAGITKAISERLDPKLRNVALDSNLALRRGRDGRDRFDADQVLVALNGAYLLRTIRECRDSLALNATFDQVWAQLGQVLEVQLERNLEMLRQNPIDEVAEARLDAGIKLAELRFGIEYADIMRRARQAAERQA
ncbi:MAG: penicillin-insensitive murein endopeptidase [Myxococcales bacterium]|nr:penicillin-insensitive murein endopeptidase [Myxococcales bacterium]